MTRHYRFFVDPAALADKEPQSVVEIVDSDLKHQVSKVLRLKDGDQITLLDGRGSLYQCLIMPEATARRPSRETITLKILASSSVDTERSCQLTVCMPLIKTARFEWALEKLTELGVHSILPVETTRTQTQPQKMTRWQAIIKEAAEQSEKTTLPTLAQPQLLQAVVTGLASSIKARQNPEATLIILLQEREKAPDMVQHLYNSKQDGTLSKVARIVILLGPEGGFTSDEKHLIINSGAIALSLGDAILRSETAALMAAGIAYLAACVK